MLFTRNKDTAEFIQKFIQYLGPFVQGSGCFRLRNSWSFCYAFQNRQSSAPPATFFQNIDKEPSAQNRKMKSPLHRTENGFLSLTLQSYTLSDRWRWAFWRFIYAQREDQFPQGRYSPPVHQSRRLETIPESVTRTLWKTSLLPACASLHMGHLD